MRDHVIIEAPSRREIIVAHIEFALLGIGYASLGWVAHVWWAMK